MLEARLTLPSSNRTCGFPASGSRENSRRRARTEECPPASPVGQPGSQERKFAPVARRASRSPEFRRGTKRSKRNSLPLTQPCFRSGPLAPRALPRFLATMGRSDSPSRPPPGYVFPNGGLRERGSPRFLDRSFPARCPLPPRRVWQVLTPIPSLPILASSNRADWPLSLCVTRPNQVRLHYGSLVRRARLRQQDRSHPRSLGFPFNGQFPG